MISMSSKTLIKYFRRKLLTFLNFSLNLSLTKNKNIKIPVIGGMGTLHRHYSKNWMVQLLFQLLSLKEGIFLDIGANIGQTLISFKATELPRKYIGFEPNPICVYYLSQLIERNHWKDCLIVPIGLSNENSLVKLYSSSDTNISPGATILETLRPNRNKVNSVIPVFQLDHVIKQLDIEHISVIKIDVEGAELEVIQGMKQIINQYRSLIICEVLFRDDHASAIKKQERDSHLWNLLKEQDYLIFQIVKTENTQTIKHLKLINHFSQEIWNHENKNLCDYLFVPYELKISLEAQFLMRTR